MREIAKVAGVSQPTVSQALRNHPRISLASRQRIQKIAQKLGYRLDPKIQELMSYLRKHEDQKYFGTIGLLLGFPETWGTEEWPHYGYLEAAEKRAEELGFKCERFFVRDKGLTDKRLNQILISRGIQGIIVFPFVKSGDLLDLQWKHFSPVLIGFNLEKPDLHRVMSDHFGGMQVVLRELADRGYTRIGYAIDERIERRLRYAWRSAFLQYQDEIEPRLRVPHYTFDVGDPDTNSQPDREELKAWLKEHQPEVVIGLPHSPRLTMQRLGVRMPEEIAYVTLDWKEFFHAELSGLNQRSDEIGATSIEKVIAMIQANEFGIPRSPQFISLLGQWHDGDYLLKKH